MLGSSKKMFTQKSCKKKVNEIFLQKPNMKSIVPKQLKFLRNKSTQTKNFQQSKRC